LSLASFAAPTHSESAPDDANVPVVVHEGVASFYAEEFRGKTTASGEAYNPNKRTAASPNLPRKRQGSRLA